MSLLNLFKPKKTSITFISESELDTIKQKILSTLPTHNTILESQQLTYSFSTDKKSKAEKLAVSLANSNHKVTWMGADNNYFVKGTFTSLSNKISIENWIVEMCNLGFSHDCLLEKVSFV